MYMNDASFWFYKHACNKIYVTLPFKSAVHFCNAFYVAGRHDMEAADREGLQRLEALGYQPSW